MTRIEQLTNWLGNRQRIYADGLTLFNDLAKPFMKDKFAAYFSQSPETPHIFDPHFTQLINSLSKIERDIKDSPALYPIAFEQIIVIKTMDDKERNAELARRNENIAELQSDIDELSIRMSDYEDTSEEHAAELSELQDTFAEKIKELAALRGEVDSLNTPGVKIVTEESLSPTLRKVYARIKEIAPIYASLHADIANTEIPDEERQALAEELCRLDDERRKCWKEIDNWAEGKGTVELKEKRPVYSENTIVRGIEIARQIKRLKSNIANSRIAAEKAGTDNRTVVRDNALTRITGYEKELAQLEMEIAGKQIE